MPKDLIEDIKRPKRSLQDVLPAVRVIADEAPKPIRENNFSEPRPRPQPQPQSQPQAPARPRRRRRWLRWVILIIVILLPIAYFVSATFGQATVTVTPRQAPITVSGLYRAVSLPSGTASSTVLGFQTMTVRATESTTVPAGEVKPVSEKASGMIVITNRYSKTPQKLIANTRFETANGKIYRIPVAVTVPGYTLTGATMTPGEITVKVTADQPGDTYNGTPTTLTLPGFKGKPQFNTITARAKTPMTGGFVGERRVVAPTALTAAQTKLDQELKNRLLAEATSQTLDEFVWYPKSVFWRVETVNASSTSETTLTRQVELVAPIFSRLELSQVLARRSLPNYDGTPALIDNLSSLELDPSQEGVDPTTAKELIFSLSGSGILTWQFDKTALVRDLLGRDASDYQSIFVKYPSIAGAKATFNPPWLFRFPKEAKRIIIETALTESEPSAKITDTTNQPDTTNGN